MDVWLAGTLRVQIKRYNMRQVIILFIILRSTVYGQVGVTSDSSQDRVSIQLKIDTGLVSLHYLNVPA